MKNQQQSQTTDVSVAGDVLHPKCFLRVFGSEQNKHLTEMFIKLLIPDREIVSIQMRPSGYEYLAESGMAIPVFAECTDQKGIRFKVVLQLVPHMLALARSVAQSISILGIKEDIPAGERSEDCTGYYVSILLFRISENTDEVLHPCSLYNTNSGQTLSCSPMYLNLEVLNAPAEVECADTPLKRVCYVMAHLPEMERLPVGWEEDEIVRLLFSAAKNGGTIY